MISLNLLNTNTFLLLSFKFSLFILSKEIINPTVEAKVRIKKKAAKPTKIVERILKKVLMMKKTMFLILI